MNMRVELLTGYDDFGNLIFLPASADVCDSQLIEALTSCPLCGCATDTHGRHKGAPVSSAGNADMLAADAMLLNSAEEA